MANIEKAREVIKAETRFYLSTPERAAEALLFVRELEKYAAELKAKVKERAVEIMEKNNMELLEYKITDQETGEVREWKVMRDYGKQSKEYRASNVIEALGMERALPFLKVGKTALESYLKKASAKGVLTMEEVGKATANPDIKIIKGSGVKIVEVKPKQ